MILGLLLQVSAGSYTMEMPRYSTECFTERLKHGDRIEIGFEVVNTNGDDKLDLTVFNPDTSNLHTVTQERASAFGFYAGQEGYYQICFYNKQSSADKTVSFSITAPDEQTVIKTTKDFSKEEKEVADELQMLSNNFRFMKDEQKHLVGLANRHKQTILSTQSRVNWFSFFQFVLLIGVCGFQVYYLKSFFEQKRGGLKI